jgi:hypothetical protein
LKANLEMLYLVDELHKQRDKTLRITFGKRIPFTTFDKRHSKDEWAMLLRDYIYKMGDGLKQPFEEWVLETDASKHDNK